MTIDRVFNIIIFSALLGFGAFFFASQTPWRTTHTAMSRTNCISGQPCIAEVFNSPIILELQPTFLPVIVPVDIKLNIPKMDVDFVALSIRGVEDYIGENRPILKGHDLHHFTGRTVFPAPPPDGSRWIIMIVMHTEHGEVLAPFEFTLTPPAK